MVKRKGNKMRSQQNEREKKIGTKSHCLWSGSVAEANSAAILSRRYIYEPCVS